MTGTMESRNASISRPPLGRIRETSILAPAPRWGGDRTMTDPLCALRGAFGGRESVFEISHTK